MGTKNQSDFIFFKDLHNQYYQLGSGLNGEAARSQTNQYVFLPSDPVELVDHLKPLYFEN